MSERRPRVLWHPVYYAPEPWNGMDEHLRLLAKHLDRERFEPLLLWQEGAGEQVPLLAERARLPIVRPAAWRGPGKLARALSLRAVLRREEIDILHIHTPAAGPPAVSVLAARLAGVPVLVTYHQVQPAPFPLRTRTVNRVLHGPLGARGIAVSEGVRESLSAMAGVPGKRIHTVPNGVDEREPGRPTMTLHREPGQILVGYFGRLSREKGLPLLLASFAELLKRSPNVRLLIVGEGSERTNLEVLAAHHGLSGSVEFLGYRSDAREIMAGVDIVAHTPAFEGFGLVLVEAMAAAKPVVIADAPGGMREIVVDGETAIVAAPEPASVAAALHRLAVDPVERRRLGENGRARWQRSFSAAAMARRVQDIYEDVLRHQLADRRFTAPQPSPDMSSTERS